MDLDIGRMSWVIQWAQSSHEVPGEGGQNVKVSEGDAMVEAEVEGTRVHEPSSAGSPQMPGKTETILPRAPRRDSALLTPWVRPSDTDLGLLTSRTGRQ